MTHLLAAAFMGWAALQEPSQQELFRRYTADRVAGLVRKVADRNASDLDRSGAFNELEGIDFDAAARMAPSLLGEGTVLRFRAAWLLGRTGDDRGIRTLREMAQDRQCPLTYPMEALGRLEDPGSHGLLRRLLEDEMSRTGPSVSLPRISGLVMSLSEYQDADDTELLTRAVSQYSPGDWVSVDRLGRTGGSEAVLYLRDVFAKAGRGWAVMSAGLALARCGDARGLRYVEEQLASAEPDRPEAREPTNGMTDEPDGPQAKHFLIERMGARRDDLFVMQLLTIASDPEQPFRPRAIAWSALLRIHSAKYRAQVLEAAWKNASFDGASRLIALDDEQNARTFLSRDEEGASPSERIAAGAIRTALSARERDKRQWCEPYGYGF